MLDWLQLADTAHLKCVVLQVRVLYLAPAASGTNAQLTVLVVIFGNLNYDSVRT